jgi:hypothetical protein
VSSRTASLASRVQRGLERFYGLEEGPPIEGLARPVDAGGREALLLREEDDGVAIAVLLPPEGLAESPGELSLDTVCQVVEGVSHFVYLAERIRREVPITQLELELQAEVDKFVVLAYRALTANDTSRAQAIHARLYDDVRYLHEAGSIEGERYRMANDLAARFCARLRLQDGHRARRILHRFYREGQAEKIRLARAA